MFPIHQRKRRTHTKLTPSNKFRKGVRRNSFAPQLESLESRQLLTVTAAISQDILEIEGTDLRDTVVVQLDSANPNLVHVDDRSTGPGPDFTFALADFDSIDVQLGDDDDNIVFSDRNGSVSELKPLHLDGGEGDNVLITSTGTLSVRTILDLVQDVQNASATLEQVREIAASGQLELLESASDLLFKTQNELLQNSVDWLANTQETIVTTASYLGGLADFAQDSTTTELIDQLTTSMTTASDDMVALATDILSLGEQLVTLAETSVVEPSDTLRNDAEDTFIVGGEDFVQTMERLQDESELYDSIPGDANGDQIVDHLDFDIWQANLLNPNPTFSHGDFDGNHIVDEHDLLIWEIHLFVTSQDHDESEYEAIVDQMESEVEAFEHQSDVFGESRDQTIDAANDFALQVDQQLAGASFDLQSQISTDIAGTAQMHTSDLATQVIARLEELDNESLQSASEVEQLSLEAANLNGLAASLQSEMQTELSERSELLAAQLGEVIADAEAAIATALSQLQAAALAAAVPPPVVPPCGIAWTNTITGGVAGTNIFIGTNQNDRIIGSNANDIILGMGGHDLILAGDGNDLVFGMSGNDNLQGEGGWDIVVGDIPGFGAGNDCLFGAGGMVQTVGSTTLTIGDLLLGEGGNDRLTGDDGAFDLMFGGNGNDTLFAAGAQQINLPGSGINIDLGDLMIGDLTSQGEVGTDQLYADTAIDIMIGGTDPLPAGVLGNADVDTFFGQGGSTVSLAGVSIDLGNLMIGGPSQDTFNGGEFIDFMLGGDASDTFNAGNEVGVIDAPLLFNAPILMGDVLFGQGGQETIIGTDRLDLIFGGNGVDTLTASGSQMVTTAGLLSFDLGDLLFGGNGADRISGGQAIDFLFGEGDADLISAGLDAGTLSITGVVSLPFGDLMHGGANDPGTVDDITGGANIDVLIGDQGDDILRDNTGSNRIDAFLLDSTIDFGNVMHGGSGTDTLTAAGGIDLMFGGAGTDSLSAADGGTVTLFASALALPVNVGNIMFGDEADNGAIASGDHSDIMNGGNDRDIMFGGPGDDTMNGLGEIDVIHGNDGSDTIDGGSNIDFLFGQGDSDTMFGGGNVDIMYGGDGNDEMHGEDNIDVMFGGDGVDTMIGGDNIDIMYGEGDGDIMEGGGNIDFLFGGEGDDELYGQDNIDFLFGNDGDDTLAGGQNTDFLFGDEDDDTLKGQQGMDFLFGLSGDDTLKGGQASDLMFGGKGRDEMFGDEALDWMFGNEEGDCMFGGDGVDMMFGGSGPDTVEGNSGADLIFGESGNDELRGQNGNDLIFGGEGGDQIYGGDFADILNGENGPDAIYGGNGIDIISGNSGSDSLFGGEDADLMFGGDGDDAIRGESGADFIFGKKDNDCIYGGTNNDVIFGSKGDDWIYGEGDKDYLFGNSGSDTMYGGPGDDRMHGNGDNDEMSGESGHDKMHGNSGNDILLGKLGDDKLYGDRHDDELDGGGDDDTVKGNWGSDVVMGGNGNDSVSGGTGSDTVDESGSLGISEFDHAPCGQIHGVKWDDENGNGIIDSGESLLAGWTVYLDLNGNEQRDPGEPFDVTREDDPNTCRDETGEYHLLELLPETYAVREEMQDGWGQTYPGPPDEEHVIDLDPGQIVHEIDFGNQEINTLEGTKWEDANGNGIRDLGEPGLAGVTIYLDENNNGTLDAGEPRTLTETDDPTTLEDELGRYRFTVGNGPHHVREIVPASYHQTYPADGHFRTVDGGEHVTDLDFGNAPLGSIRGMKWHDLDHDGIHDANEPGMGDVTIYLDLDNDGVLDSDGPNPEPSMPSQNGTGFFWFNDLLPGSYVVREVERDELVRTFPAPHDYHLVELDWGTTITGLKFGNFFADELDPEAEIDIDFDVEVRPVDDDGFRVPQARRLGRAGQQAMFHWFAIDEDLRKQRFGG